MRRRGTTACWAVVCLVLSACCLAPGSVFAYDVTIGVGRNLIANQLNHAGGNCISNIFPTGKSLPDGTLLTIYKKDTCADPQIIYYDTTTSIAETPGWFYSDEATPIDPSPIFLNPGDALMLDWCCLGAATLSFSGTPNTPVLPLSLSCGGCGHYFYLSRQTNDVGTFENITGLSPQEGSQFQRWNGLGFNVFTFSAGAWTPSFPSANVGEAVRILPAPRFSNNCLTLRVPTNIVVASWTNIPVVYTPTGSDTCTNAPNVICTPRSGTLFALGTTTPVHCLAVDTNGNGAVGDFTVTVAWPELQLSRAGAMMTLSWSGGGVLQEADSPSGSWTNVPGGNASPYTTNQSGLSAKFYRLHFQ